jgi:hypothetical protein
VLTVFSSLSREKKPQWILRILIRIGVFVFLNCRLTPYSVTYSPFKPNQKQSLSPFRAATPEDRIISVQLLGCYPRIALTITQTGAISLLDVLSAHVVAQIVLPKPYMVTSLGEG